MECSICHKHPAKEDGSTKEDGLHCASCALNIFYPVRLELAKVMLEKETHGRTVEQITSPEPGPNMDEDAKKMSAAWWSQFETGLSIYQREQDEEMERELEEKKKYLEELKAKVQEKKEYLAQRRSNIKVAKDALFVRGKKKLEEAKAAGEKAKAEHDAIHNRTMEAKEILCREAATLLRLRHTKVKTKDGTLKDRYFIAGLVLPDLKEINSKSSPSNSLESH